MRGRRGYAPRPDCTQSPRSRRRQAAVATWARADSRNSYPRPSQRRKRGIFTWAENTSLAKVGGYERRRFMEYDSEPSYDRTFARLRISFSEFYLAAARPSSEFRPRPAENSGVTPKKLTGRVPWLCWRIHVHTLRISARLRTRKHGTPATTRPPDWWGRCAGLCIPEGQYPSAGSVSVAGETGRCAATRARETACSANCSARPRATRATANQYGA
jgi:hypothetical protein